MSTIKNNKTLCQFVIAALLAVLISGCSVLPKKSSSGGGYYQDDGPSGKKVDIDKIPDATPRREPYNRAASKPYTVNGKRYIPLESAVGYLEEGHASWYGKKYHGRKTAIGEVYDMFAMTAAHPTLPIPSYVRVTNVANQRSVVVRVNDRGPFIGNRIIDLSYVAAQKLKIVNAGTGQVIVESISPDASQDQQYRYTTPQPVRPQEIPSQNQNNGTVWQNPSSPPKPSYQSPSFGQQWLQVGAFSIVSNAQKIQSELLSQGYNDAQIIQKDGLYKVVVGPYAQGQLDSTYRSLKGRGYSVVRVVN